MRISKSNARFLLSLALGVLTLSLVILASNVGFLPLRGNSDEDALLTQPQPPVDGDDGDNGPGRLGWFYLQRAYPQVTIPPAARAQALEQVDFEETWMKTLSWAVGEPSVLELQPAWTPLGPMPLRFGQTFSRRVSVSGRVSAVALDPRYDGVTNRTVYIGAAQGGVWRSTDNGANWTPLTDDQPSLAMGAIAIDPTNPAVIYAGTGEGHLSGDSYFGAGLLKSSDGGATWAQITGPISSLPPHNPAFLNAGFLALAIDPVAPATLFAATEGVTFSFAAVGVTEFAPTGDRGIWKSTDGGLTWRNVNPPNAPALDKSGSDVLIDPANPQRVFAALRGVGLYRSTAGGEPGTWVKLTTGLPAAGFSRIKLAAGPPLPPATDLTLYGAFSNLATGNLRGVFKSTDGGATWAQVATPAFVFGGADYALALAVDPVDANVVYFGSFANNAALLRSANGGASWLNISFGNTTTGGLHVDTHDIVVSRANRNILFTANDGGVWRTDNALAATGPAVAWAPLNDTLNITQFQAISLDPSSLSLIGGTQDNGTNIGFSSAFPAWNHVRDGDGGFTVNDYALECVLYHTFFNANNFGGASAVIGPEITFNCGNTWFRRGCFGCATQLGNFNPADRVAFYAPMAQHTAFSGPTGNIIYFGTHRLYRTANQGVTWTGLGASADGFGADLTGGTILFPQFSGFPGFISAIAAHQTLNPGADPPGEVVWTGSGDGVVQVTTNAGALNQASFTNVTKPPLPNRFVTDIALDPHDQLRAVVTYSGFNTNTSATPGHVFATTDRGATWRDISGNLPDLPVNSVALDPTSVKVIYVGTDIGVFHTTDGGATWIRLANGLPKVTVPMLRLHTATRGLVAATHGRGVFRLMINDAPLGCARGQGYWKNHAEVWPTGALMLGNQIYSQAEALDILDTPVGGDASLILARQLIAAKLSIGSGANNTAITATVASADAWLRNYAGKLPYDVKTSTPAGQTAVSLANTLEQYSNGNLSGGPPACN